MCEIERMRSLIPSRLLEAEPVTLGKTSIAMNPSSADLVLIVERDATSLQTLRAVIDRLGCGRIEANTPESLNELLAVHRPTIAVLAIDQIQSDGLAVFESLVRHGACPATVLVGSVNERVLASARRAAETRGLKVIGVSARPLDAAKLESLIAARLTRPPPIPRHELDAAIAEQTLFVQYEPKVAIAPKSLKIQGVEALVRWRHPQRGLLFPRQFLYAIEDYGLMMSLTDLVMTEAVRQAGQWRVRGLHLQMIINLSFRLVTDSEFPERLAALLREFDVPAEQIVLDVTEAPDPDQRLLMQDVFTRLRIRGVGLALDNFGTSMAALTELYRVPYSEIKIDHSLLADVELEQDARLIVKALADLAHTLELTVCAQGVETRETLEFVRAVGFDTAQGRVFGGSMNATEIERLVDAWPGSAPAATGIWRTSQLAHMTDAGSTRRVRRPKVVLVDAP
jgi:EAL domain-containing protein (putative c-di-GMP-specific phosphodiesterase class I)